MFEICVLGSFANKKNTDADLVLTVCAGNLSHGTYGDKWCMHGIIRLVLAAYSLRQHLQLVRELVTLAVSTFEKVLVVFR